MTEVVTEQRRAKTVMNFQDFKLKQINLMKRKKGLLLDVFRVRARLQRLSDPYANSLHWPYRKWCEHRVCGHAVGPASKWVILATRM